jgi:copper oxidase (laccase) domain-containing protein
LIAAIEQLEKMGSRRSELLVALGPAVSGSNYQVQRQVSIQIALGLGLAHQYPGPVSPERALEELRSCDALQEDHQPGHDRLDIRAAARYQLELHGIPASQIALCPLCTLAEPLLFHSWRRDQVKAVQWSGIVSQA